MTRRGAPPPGGAARAILAIGPLIVACAPPIVGVEVPVVERRDPSITEVELTCDADLGVWALTLHTDAWSSGALTHWTVDGVYVERHRANSVSAAADGTRDELLLELTIVSDWRTATPNSSTAFACASAPAIVAYVQDLDGVPTDCRGWGPDPGVWQGVERVFACPHMEE